MKEHPPAGCPGKNHKLEHFLEVCLLLLLYNEIGHGYRLMEQLEQFGFTKEELNVSTLYRTLRKMEKEELVCSCWEEGGPGPKRRTYKITATGKEDLSQWINILKMRKSMIEQLIAVYAETIHNDKETK
ncbi:helix-turn-helix transcriptional regulator [Sphaerochaeta sp.]|uniref:helix-turn-helix transcriptional regulator n=1 Tax=Sphaerochaeta sp. TaxID=1972642 RepID=UPI003D0BC932